VRQLSDALRRSASLAAVGFSVRDLLRPGAVEMPQSDADDALVSGTSDPARSLVPTLPSGPSGRSCHNQVVGLLIHALPSWSSQPLVPILAVIMDGSGHTVLDPDILTSQLIGIARTGHGRQR
jgi:hypothetical protein